MNILLIVAVFGLIAGSYLIGSISFAVIISNIFGGKDVRDFGSGNAGMTNVMRVVGVLPGILTFVLDFAKGFLAAGMGKIVFQSIYTTISPLEFFTPLNGALIGALFCMVGHVLPVFFKFKGGKAVATGCGAFLAICPLSVVVGLAVFGICFLLTKIISVSSLLGTVAVVIFSMCTVGLGPKECVVFQIIMHILPAAIIYIKHSENIVRLIRGEEKKLTVKKEK